jgi:hypothetical protein
LRFDRDRRGYETTALLHAGRGRGKRLLYWFRTPPGVRVGRAPIDETAIRLLEQHNPDVQFDWTRILKAPPAAEGQGRRDLRDGRDRDQRGRREQRSGQRSRSGGSRVPGSGLPVLAAKHRALDGLATEYAEHADQLAADQMAANYAEHADQATRAEHAEHAEPAEQPAAEHMAWGAESASAAHPALDAEAVVGVTADEARPQDEAPVQDLGTQDRGTEDRGTEDRGTASYQRLGAEGLVRLRARYAEVMARIAERPLEEEAREELKQRAERLNPDAWVTADEVAAALEQYETVFEGLRGIVGRHPRRRRRGRR